MDKPTKKAKKVLVVLPGVLPGKATLNPIAFGKALMDIDDLDPIYGMLAKANLDEDTLCRWLLAYSCFYNAGVASFCAENPKRFWQRLKKGHDDKWPRGSERRHFRGGTSEYVTNWLPTEYATATDAVMYLAGPDKGRTFKRVSGKVQTWKYFGPWIAFKWADLIERVMQKPTDFSDCSLDLYESPQKGSAMIAAYYGKPDLSIAEVASKLEKAFSSYKAAPWYDRPINIQEAETVMCKWKSHCSGHYPVGNDIVEIRHALENWGDLAETLQKLLAK